MKLALPLGTDGEALPPHTPNPSFSFSHLITKHENTVFSIWCCEWRLYLKLLLLNEASLTTGLTAATLINPDSVGLSTKLWKGLKSFLGKDSFKILPCGWDRCLPLLWNLLVWPMNTLFLEETTAQLDWRQKLIWGEQHLSPDSKSIWLKSWSGSLKSL